jgi:hypothetical protein
VDCKVKPEQVEIELFEFQEQGALVYRFSEANRAIEINGPRNGTSFQELKNFVKTCLHVIPFMG